MLCKDPKVWKQRIFGPNCNERKSHVLGLWDYCIIPKPEKNRITSANSHNFRAVDLNVVRPFEGQIKSWRDICYIHSSGKESIQMTLNAFEWGQSCMVV